MFTFKSNNNEFSIIEVDSISETLTGEKNDSVQGYCDFNNDIVYIKKSLNEKRKIQVVLHEVTHAIAESHGFYHFETLNQEQVAEFVSSYARQIVNIADDYFKYKESEVNNA